MLCVTALLVKALTVLVHLILPSLVGMQDRPVLWAEPSERLAQHRADHVEERPLGRCVRKDLAVEQVHDRRQVQLLSIDLELGNVSHPLLIGTRSIEVPLKQVWSNLPHLPAVRPVLLQADERLQLQLFHETLHCLVVDQVALLAQCRGDAPIAISAFVQIVDRLDLVFDGRVFVHDQQGSLLVIKGASRQASCSEERRERILRP